MKTNHTNRLSAVLVTCALMLAATGAVRAQDVSEEDIDLLNAMSRVSRAVVEKVQPTVVYIGTEEKVSIDGGGMGGWALPPGLERLMPDFRRRRTPGTPRRRRNIMRRGLGSGFVISKDGWIVTNDHVIKDADKVYVRLFDDEETYEAKEIYRDRKSELAVIKIEVDRELPVVSFGDSDALMVGDLVMAFGNPLGLTNSVSRGIVSAKKRRNLMPRSPDGPAILYENFIQTDAAINRGNSGGPLVNMRGEVVGVNTLIATPYNIGIGFAIPSAIAKRVTAELMETGEVKRGWLGIQMQPLNPNLREALGTGDHGGVLVIKVNKGDPADRGGVKVEDVLLEYDGVKITDAGHVQFLVADTPAGKKVDILILRGGKKQTLTIEVGAQSGDTMAALSAETSETSYETLGLTVDTLDEQTARALGLKKANGVFISNVDVEGPAYEAGLRPGQVIVKVNQKPVATVEEFKDAVAETPEGKMILLRVKTAEGEFLTAMKPAAQ